YQDLVTSIHAGEHIAFFPEGTTSAQGTVLPFHANLFEAAIDAQVPVQPYAVRYVGADGMPHPAVEYIGEMTFAQSMVLILRARGVVAQLTPLPVIETTGMHRRDLAQVAREAIVTELGCGVEVAC
ncbi:MAG: 1-acyl-sn-glycerol-3-phosphate acyltransferase, partial [Herminiimonas sp.]|nr:1-acyl-sn-glycerol-3-phosphate acyltransferase [Herminiimonas sp.]